MNLIFDVFVFAISLLGCILAVVNGHAPNAAVFGIGIGVWFGLIMDEVKRLRRGR